MFKINPLVPVSDEAVAFDSRFVVVYDEFVSLRAYGGAGNIRWALGGT
jgi:hypothetical protein